MSEDITKGPTQAVCVRGHLLSSLVFTFFSKVPVSYRMFSPSKRDLLFFRLSLTLFSTFIS